jgi:hypothetical protein
MITAITVWVIGWWFTWGVMVSRRGLKFLFGDWRLIIASIIVWPWALGLLLGEKD